MKKISIGFLTAGLLAFAIQNCAVFNSVSTASQSLDSVSTSLNSVSKSIGSISRSLGSISDSSSAPEKEEKAALYRKDVESLVSLYGKNAELVESMEDDIARIANQNGILNWREYKGTYSAIGAGLKSAGYSQEDVLKISKLSCPGKEELQDAILEGYKA